MKRAPFEDRKDPQGQEPTLNETQTETSPLATVNQPPRFDVLSAEGIVPTVRALIAQQNQALAALEANCPADWDGMVEPLTDLAEPLTYAWRLVHHLLGVKNSPALREAEQTIQSEVIGAGLRLGQSEPVYKAFCNLRDGAAWSSLDEAQRRIVTSTIQAAELAGIGLLGEERERFTKIEMELAELSTKFQNNVLDATKAFFLVLTRNDEVEGLPPSWLAAAAQNARAAAEAEPLGPKASAMKTATAENGPWRVTLDMPVYIPFMEHARRRDLRETLYRAQVTRASAGDLDNQPLIVRILELRHEKARLLGFTDFAALSLSRKMAKTADAVSKMLNDLRATARPAARKEYEQLVEFARAKSGEGGLELALWDIAYWAERQREELYAFTDEEVRPFFTLPAVLEGLFGVAERLFGVHIEAADGETPVWHPDVRFFRVKDENDAPIAAFFLDPYSRPAEKRGGAWMDVCLDRRRRTDGRLRLPIAYLTCNQTPPVDGKPSLMTFSEVETLFHEFGHGLQHMLTRVDYLDAAGINNVEWDAVELPSQFMENWCYHQPTVMGFARHYETGVPLPADLFTRIVAARNYRAGSQFLRQVYFATLDMSLHHASPPKGTTGVLATAAQVAADNTIVPPLPEDRFLCSFGHIFAGGYAAGYYSYKWAEVLAADAFAAFEEVGLDDLPKLAEVGRRFRETVLALGGGKAPADVFRAFRGRDPDAKALLRSYGLSA
ncbi:MAG: M3 family metallopeptidase [Myxococcales bacterium]|nr:M3 family metallopeptidase [Myxococcales bacterium]